MKLLLNKHIKGIQWFGDTYVCLYVWSIFDVHSADSMVPAVERDDEHCVLEQCFVDNINVLLYKHYGV